MDAPANPATLIKAANRIAPFNVWAGFIVENVDDSGVELRLPWRPEFGQYSGFLHAGMVGALIDTVCGYAAAARTGKPVLASHYSVSLMSPAIGHTFIARGKVIRAGRRQIFTSAELHAVSDEGTKLVATGETILMTIGDKD